MNCTRALLGITALRHITNGLVRSSSSSSLKGHLGYIQGQYGSDNRRQYFYYVDHQGMLFLDDAKMKNFTSCFKDKQFLKMFFKRLKSNYTGHYTKHFPYLSPCAGERNFVRCEDIPIVFTEVITEDPTKPKLSHNHGGKFLTVPFEPSKVYMDPLNGRVYHPAEGLTGDIGLISDKISILWTQERRFIFGEGEDKPPTEFVWNDEKVKLTNHLSERITQNES